MPATLRLNPNAEIRRETISGELQCVVVDEFLADPQAVVDWAAGQAASFEKPEGSYPGQVLELPPDGLGEFYAFIREHLSGLFGFAAAGIRFSTLLSLTCLPPERFNWLQRLPHCDPPAGPGRANFAAVLYLFDCPELGGTGFFRWRDEAFLQSVLKRHQREPERAERLLRLRYPEFADPPAYVHDSTESVELLHRVPARFNRLLFYSGDIPHSACIADAGLLDRNVRSGRLTLNCFANVRPVRSR